MQRKTRPTDSRFMSSLRMPTKSSYIIVSHVGNTTAIISMRVTWHEV